MKLFNILFLMSIVMIFIFIFGFSFLFAQSEKEKFIYDSQGRRDPFIPLLDRDTPKALRSSFTPPEEKVKLPLEIKVKGMLWSGKEYFAIINDKVMKKGENINGVKIKMIEQDKVVMEYDEREFTVFLRKEKEK